MNALDSISDAFLSARRNAVPLSGFPGEVPADLATAYSVQARSTERWGEPVVGYKVGGIGPQWRARYPSPWLAGPVFPSLVQSVEKDGSVEVPVYEGGFAAFEPELVFRIRGHGDLDEAVLDIETAKRFVTDVHIGAEIASSPFSGINDAGPGSIISDFGNQCGVVIGPRIDCDWLDRLEEMTVTMTIDGQHIGRTQPNPGAGGPLGALMFLLNHIRMHGLARDLPDEILLSSGAITGVHRADVGAVGRIDYDELGSMSITLTRKTPLSADVPG
ncbi:MAG: hypothetical protein WBG08_05365 [Litorimonas sp.]